MNVGLMAVDSDRPNLALMKISAYHKSKGDFVEWYTPFSKYDVVYMSKIFSFTEDFRHYMCNTKKIVKGGTGYDIHTRLPEEMEYLVPDYSIYPSIDNKTAYGFLTRGCPRGCNFCHVEAKEGRCSHKVADLNEFWSGQKNIVLCDPNILACKDWKPLLQQLIDSKAWIDINQGLDIRLMTEEKAQMIKSMKTKELHFAWDRYEDKEMILPKFKMFKEITGISERKLIVYVLCNFDTTIEQDLERIYMLREMGYWAYVMLYDKEHIPRGHELKKMARWVNNRFIFAKCETFEDYMRR